MKKIRFLGSIIFTFAIFLQSSGLGDVKILEASNNIKYITQNIAKNYIYLYIYNNKLSLRKNIDESIMELENEIRIIAANTQDEKIKYILDFFAYEKEQIKLIVSRGQTTDSSIAVLDFSEAVTEGAQNIFDSVGYSFSAEEKMLMRSQNINFLIERLAKYYMVIGSNIDKSMMRDKANSTTSMIRKELKFIEEYLYPESINAQKIKIHEFWKTIEYFSNNAESIKVPSIMLESINNMKLAIEEIATYHSKVEQ